MAEQLYYFQVDFEGQATVQPSAYGEGMVRRSAVVEVGPDALTPAEGDTARARQDAAAEVARTVANEIVRDEIPTIGNEDGEVTPLDEFPPTLQDAEPSLDDPGIRAWLLEPAQQASPGQRPGPLTDENRP